MAKKNNSITTIVDYIEKHNYFSQDLDVAYSLLDELLELEDIVYTSPITLEDYLDYVKANKKQFTI